MEDLEDMRNEALEKKRKAILKKTKKQYKLFQLCTYDFIFWDN